MKRSLPDAMRIGVPFNPAQDNDKTNLTDNRAAVTKAGLQVVELGFGVLGKANVALRSNETILSIIWNELVTNLE